MSIYDDKTFVVIVQKSTMYKLKEHIANITLIKIFLKTSFMDFLLDFKGNQYKLCLQYQFDDIQHPIHETPHGNSKNGSLYTRTKSSVTRIILKKALLHKLFDKMQRVR